MGHSLMKTRFLCGLVALTFAPMLAFSASTTTSYFLNVEAITNVMARSAVRGLTGVFTNSLSAAGLNTIGTTNATLTGNLLANGAVFTNGVTAGASVITNSASTDIGLTVNGFSGQTNDIHRIGAGGTNYNKTTGTGTFQSIVGTASNVSFGIGDTNTGFHAASGVLSGVIGGLRVWTGSSSVLNAAGGVLNLGVNSDCNIVREAANIFQFGGNDAASPSAATIKGVDGSGTDRFGGALNLAGGKSTGNAASGPVILQTANSAGGSASTVNTFTERFHAVPKWVTLTTASATTIFTIPVPATNYVGLTATVTIYATDGTDHQSKTSVITVDAIAKTTTITPTLSQVDNTTAASAGTLTCTYTAVDNTSNVLAIKANAVSSLTETVLRAKVVITAINSNGTAAVTEQ
jgi:hypothetical protein